MMLYWRHLQVKNVLSERSEKKIRAWHNTGFWLLWIVILIICGGFLI